MLRSHEDLASQCPKNLSTLYVHTRERGREGERQRSWAGGREGKKGRGGERGREREREREGGREEEIEGEREGEREGGELDIYIYMMYLPSPCTLNPVWFTTSLP